MYGQPFDKLVSDDIMDYKVVVCGSDREHRYGVVVNEEAKWVLQNLRSSAPKRE